MQATSVVSVNNFDIENLVREATWKEILVGLVKKNELNPWDIDIIEIVEGYIGVVKRMKVLDLRVPANIILAAAILLRLKSDMLELEETVPETTGAEEMARPYVSVDPLSVRLRLPPRRRVSLQELIGALEEAMKLKEYREAQAASEIKTIPMEFRSMDPEADIEAIYQMVSSNIDASKLLTFSLLCDIANKENALLDVFIPLLFLASKDRLMLLQEEFFGEILIALN